MNQARVIEASASAQDAPAPEEASGRSSRLEAHHLQKSYGSRTVVKDVSLSVGKGEVVGLLGPNGAGKTTSFYMIVGLVRASAGDILIDGQSVEHMPIHRRARLGLSYLPQEASIFRKLNVEDNVRAVLELQTDGSGRRLDPAVIEERLSGLLQDLRRSGFWKTRGYMPKGDKGMRLASPEWWHANREKATERFNAWLLT